MQVNRYLKDKAMDHIDHALGRPVNPLVESYRDHFAVDQDSPEADQFRASDNWKEGDKWPCGMTFFHVSDAGRRALAKHLRGIGDKHREFLVTFDGCTTTVVAETASKARYAHYLNIGDCLPYVDFGEFAQACSVRVVRPLSTKGDEDE